MFFYCSRIIFGNVSIFCIFEDSIKKIFYPQNALKSFNNELVRYKQPTAEVLKALKKVSVNFMELSTTYTGKCKAFDFVTTAERIDIEYAMKMMQNITYEALSNLSEKLDLYYKRSLARIDVILKLIEKSKEEI